MSREPWFSAPGGSRENPLTLRDLPFTVPATGRYWLDYGQGATLMPESPAGAVIALSVTSRGADSDELELGTALAWIDDDPDPEPDRGADSQARPE